MLYLLKKIYLQLKSWDDLMALLPELRQQKVFKAEVLDELEKQVHQNRLQATADRADALHKCWSTIPESIRQQPPFIHLYATKLQSIGAEHEVETLLRHALKSAWGGGGKSSLR